MRRLSFTTSNPETKKFQYRKRYEVTCDEEDGVTYFHTEGFQYRKRYEVTCDSLGLYLPCTNERCFNTASGMRSHATLEQQRRQAITGTFQYRKRYEVTCDVKPRRLRSHHLPRFNTASGMRSHATLCLGGRRNRRLRRWFWKTSSNRNG